MPRKKLSTTIYITPEQDERLKALHARTNVPIAFYIRQGIDLVLAKHDHLLPGQTTLRTEVTVPAAAGSSHERDKVRP